MEFREFTSSILTFWGAGCAEHILKPLEYTTFIRRRNYCLNAYFQKGLSGIVGIDWGRIVSFSFEMPIEVSPLPILGKNISVVICHWISPPLATNNYKTMLWERTIELIKLRGFGGISLLSPLDAELHFFESFGFSKIAETDAIGITSSLLFLNLTDVSPPAVKQPSPLPPPSKRKYAIDIFYPEYCPIGTLVLNNVLRNIGEVAKKIEVRVHDTIQRDVVLKYGRAFGCYLNGKNITPQIISGKSLSEIFKNLNQNTRFTRFH